MFSALVKKTVSNCFVSSKSVRCPKFELWTSRGTNRRLPCRTWLWTISCAHNIQSSCSKPQLSNPSRTKHVLYHSDARKRGDNIILMGSPGAGKTTVGQILADQLGMPVVDIDNDYLERVWNMPVGEKVSTSHGDWNDLGMPVAIIDISSQLSEVGSDGFVEAEGQALLQFNTSGSIVSLTGSNPLHKEAMEHAKTLGTVVYLDVEDNDILKRLAVMKVDRIVGQNEGTSMKDILQFRKQFYEGCYDIRVLCEKDEPAESIANKVLDVLRRRRKFFGYTSTRQSKRSKTNHNNSHTFLNVVLEGLAPDGGLFVPSSETPKFTAAQWERLVDCSFQDRAMRILEAWISPEELHPSLLKGMIHKAYSHNFQHQDIAPVVRLNDNEYILELFHGPTASFKDLALQLTHQFFDRAVHEGRGGSKYLILVATSGDTGSAVLEGFKHSDSALVLVLYPLDGVSAIQKAQMTSSDGSNLRVVAVEEDFDFCQTAIKTVFSNSDFNTQLERLYGVRLSAANSINWGRLLPQVVYHASAYLDLVQNGVISIGEEADICVPTGNFGNILAAYYAKEMGIPFANLVCASNENNILSDFFHTGCYDMRGRVLQRTVSPSIDILRSSNIERLLYHVTGEDGDVVTDYFKSLDTNKYFQVSENIKQSLSTVFRSDWADQDTSMRTLKTVYEATGYLLDPHTAVAKRVAEKFLHINRPMIITATAHYSKFGADVLRGLHGACPRQDTFEKLRALSASPPMHRYLERAMCRPRVHSGVICASVEAVEIEVFDFLKDAPH